uniref:Protein FAM177A1 n=1 Tax=Cacopsylla melanoneura TaxID=428564 RepID=A0A8D8W586_9HEMI
MVLVRTNTESSPLDESETQTKLKLKQPRRILHFSDGTLEEYSTDEETDQVDNTVCHIEPPTDWIPWIWYTSTNAAYKALQVCDMIGEYLAHFFGITSPKYHAEIEYYKESLQARQMMTSQTHQNSAFNAEAGSVNI